MSVSATPRVDAMPRIDAPAVPRHRPRTRVGTATAALLNRLARPREPVEVVVEGLSLRLAPGAIRLDPVPAVAGAVDLVLDAAGERLVLRLPGTVLDRLARALQPDLPGLPGEPAGSLLVELALAPLLAAAERITGTTLAVASVRASSEASSGHMTLLVEGHLTGEPFRAQLDLGPPSPAAPGSRRLAAVLALIEAAPPRAAVLSALPVVLRFVAGHVRLTARQLAGLEPGDAVLPDLWHPASGEIRVVLGDGLVAVARTDCHTSTLRTPFGPAALDPAAASGDAAMTQVQAGTGAAVEGSGMPEAGLDTVGVSLTFELGRRTLGLGELKGIGEGHVFDLGLDPAQPVDLVANGVRIGRGEIVEVGERIGVRVVRLFGRD
ncbi:type III secretion system cytoplasmic ring protein SctQ [Methylobacterium aquaticum]|uniref:type III secretion system cytoplasmic ring protein SctQ n=1 Tax=Methylobacterium aquaticum TaxID=270351 RepID=UPI003D174AD2